METPSSIRRVTRSQAKASMIPISRKNEESDKSASRQRNVKIDRSALIDITNDSPIVGLAMGGLGTPSSLIKKRHQQQPTQTPGSGEALLRGQVKILLQQVEEEAELSKLSLEKGPLLGLKAIRNSPSGLLAPTPANTPQVPNLSDVIIIDVADSISQLKEESEIYQGESMLMDESENCDVTRALLFDFFEKSEITDFSSCSSVLTTEGSVCREKSTEEDDASVWSIQVNASMRDEEEDIEEEDYNNEEVDELCEGLSKLFVQKTDFEGKHTRFVYNSDGEMEGEEVVGAASSPSILRLKGMPAPEGKHLRFTEEV